MSDIDGERTMEFTDVLDVSIEQFMANVLPIMNRPCETLAPEDAEVARQLKDILAHSPDTTRVLSSPTSMTSREVAPADTSFSFDRSTSTDDTLSGYDTSFVRQGDSFGLSDSSDSFGDLRSLSISSLSQSQELALFKLLITTQEGGNNTRQKYPVWFRKMQVRVEGRTHSPTPSFSRVSTSSIPVDRLRGRVETVEVIVAEMGKEVKELGKEVKELNTCFMDLAEEMKRRDEETEKRFAQLGKEMKDIKGMLKALLEK